MNKKLKFHLSLLFILVFTLMGCQSQNEKSKTVKLDFMVNSSDSVLNAYEEIAEKFSEENENIKVTVTGQGKDFESLIKAKMATNDLPDLWTTHGWSVERYSEYLEPLNNQQWASKINETLIPIISNDAGEIFVLPLDVDKSGVLINEVVLEKANVNVDDLKSWDDFLSAFESVSEIGKVPVGMGGKDPRILAHFLDVMSTQMFIASPSNDYSKELLEGTFDWSKWENISEVLLDLKEKGYLNKDILTADGDSVSQQMAQGEIAFMFTTNSTVQNLLEYNPEAKIAFIPLPTFYSDGHPILIGGERNAVGLWKDSKHKEEALKFLDYLSKEKNMKLVAEAEGQAAAFKDVNVDLGTLTESHRKYETVEIHPYFDREYLPSGMWSTLQTVGGGLISGDLTIEKAINIMESDYNRLRSESE